MLEEVPVIDLAPFLSNEAAGRKKVVDGLTRAAEEIGFFTIIGHGVPEATVHRLYTEAREFFELPLEEKQKVAPPSRDYPRGWKAVGFEALAFGNDLKTPTDLKEYYHFGRESWPESHPYYASDEGRRTFHRNVWPARPAGLRTAADAYYRAMEKLSEDLCRASALALGLEENYFQQHIDKHITATRINYYPRQENPPAEGQLRAGAHTDYGMLTILSGENAPGGLQVQTRSGKWVNVTTDPHRFVCNIGDLLMRWTNDRWVSNVHRVLNPPREVARSTSRISIGFFHHPNYDANVECIPSCTDQAHPPKYEPVRSGDFRDYKYSVTREQKSA
jgi:isopenicillin N synthase-like dioxygenase